MDFHNGHEITAVVVPARADVKEVYLASLFMDINRAATIEQLLPDKEYRDLRRRRALEEEPPVADSEESYLEYERGCLLEALATVIEIPVSGSEQVFAVAVEPATLHGGGFVLWLSSNINSGAVHAALTTLRDAGWLDTLPLRVVSKVQDVVVVEFDRNQGAPPTPAEVARAVRTINELSTQE